MEKNYRGAGLRVLNEHAVAECRVYPGSLETCLGLLTGLYEKVINVKADVAAVLVSATKRREW